jgi:hypothetical protein
MDEHGFRALRRVTHISSHSAFIRSIVGEQIMCGQHDREMPSCQPAIQRVAQDPQPIPPVIPLLKVYLGPMDVNDIRHFHAGAAEKR